MAALSDYPVGAVVLFRLSARSAPVRCMVSEHILAGEVETTPGVFVAHPDLLSLMPEDGGYAISARLNQVALQS